MTTKKHTATLLILMVLGLTGLVHAQMHTMIKAQVPFNFVANGETMPAGECTIAINGQRTNNAVDQQREAAHLRLPHSG